MFEAGKAFLMRIHELFPLIKMSYLEQRMPFRLKGNEATSVAKSAVLKMKTISVSWRSLDISRVRKFNFHLSPLNVVMPLRNKIAKTLDRARLK